MRSGVDREHTKRTRIMADLLLQPRRAGNEPALEKASNIILYHSCDLIKV